MKQEFCRILMTLCGNKIPVLSNQENFLLKGNNYKVKQALPNCHIIFKGGKKQNLDRGRPSNGMFIAIPDRFNGSVLDVSPEHWRLQAVTSNVIKVTFLL